MTALNEMQKYIYVSKYAKYLPQQKTRENWRQTVDRLRSMMLTKYAYAKIDDEINFAYDCMYKKRVLGSQRLLQFGGEPVLRRNARCFNCWYSPCDRLRFFSEAIWILLMGGGTGYSVQRHHVENFQLFTKKRHTAKKKYSISDDSEGWGDAVGILLSSYFENPLFEDYYNCNIVFNYDKIRPRGSILSSSNGLAPGPDPLRKAIEKIRQLLEYICVKQRKLEPINCYDILCHCSDCVLSGGVRRSSSICLFSHDDQEMLEAKTGNWQTDNPQRARSNNSVMLLRDETSFEQFNKIIQLNKNWGEPGIYWCDNLEHGTNPCSEVGLYAYDEDGNSSWQPCNLSTINGGDVKDKEDFYQRCKAASILGTLQSAFTNLDYLGPIAKKIAEREALIGVSITGTMNTPDITLDPQIQRKGASIVKQTNKTIAKKLGINQAARTCCLKPEGSSSLLCKTSSGLHPHHARRYIRRVQNNIDEQPYQHFKKNNPQATEKSVWNTNSLDENILFPIEVPDGIKTKNDLSAIEMLEIVKSTQQNWVNGGRNKELCVKPYLSHSVSNTIIIKPQEWDSVIQYVYKNRKHLAGISLISASGDLDYDQAPCVSVLTSREILKKYGDFSLFCSGLIELGLLAFNNNLWAACEALINNNFDKPLSVKGSKNLRHASIQAEFHERSKKFAKKYFQEDIKQLTYCLKEVYNYKTWYDLSQSFNHVDYSTMIEDRDSVNHIEDVACGGGKCLI